ncbi:hypothetical protein 7F11_21 [uncultured Caudovirales phage]|uniref:Uncharacterized protein n=1 Tax=uncultured Caudovirales phage TaxID=2100421 RepID=A0A2H4IZT5_9CAUD|nr:hypothetical protein [Pseudomonas carnis]ASN67352.1 hypothetical protein 7AX2_54 [uncultured phage]ASN68154.1 hypothetical protein 7S5_33 [uncultured Caudovirales phage]ASN68858.1 hypothetical protein 10F10_35 [uncultured Caudovirales phage]ASN68917.1 hypothetical protein 7F11_21 [uncultured Caudovirales phage]ASN68991.1 hypothetical protein 8AX2_20 [uncultured Caudovirales phage]
MTNKELIAKLKKLPPNAVVFVQATDQSAHESEGQVRAVELIEELAAAENVELAIALRG